MKIHKKLKPSGKYIKWMFLVGICLLFTVLTIESHAQKLAQFSLEIPDSLSKDADAVVLFSNTTFIRSSLPGLKENHHTAITILSESGDRFASFVLGYNKFSSVDIKKCVIYSADGKFIRKLKKDEIRDYAAYDGFTLYSDYRIKQFSVIHPTYPYTIELEYEYIYDGFMAIPAWFAVSNYDLGVREASVTIKFPADLIIAHNERNIPASNKTESTEPGFQVVNWMVNGIKPLKYERFSPGFNETVPSVSFTPIYFIFDKEEGNINDWRSLGEWNHRLLPGQYKLSENTKSELLKLKNQSADKNELIRLVYHFMQSKTRYVGIQLGIGGVKPFSPEVVDRLGYGDCKALSYYTKALLEFVGIPSIYTVIGVNNHKIEFDDFASLNQMNHAILCVPCATDTIWLECTSQVAPFNYLGQGSAGRKALLIQPEGGKLVKTAALQSSKSENLATINCENPKKITCELVERVSGLFFDQNSYLAHLSEKELREETLKKSPISDIQLASVEVIHHQDSSVLEVHQHFSALNLVSQAGQRLIAELNPFGNIPDVAGQTLLRRNPVHIDESLEFSDQIEFILPESYSLEHCPKGESFTSKYGIYQSDVVVGEKKVKFSRTLKLNQGRYPREEYSDFIGFLKKVALADRCKMVLISR